MLPLLLQALICAFAIGHTTAAPTPMFGFTLGATCAFALVPIGWAAIIVAVCRNSRNALIGRGHNLDRWLHVHLWGWVAGSLGMIYAANWPGLVHAYLAGESIFLIDQVLVVSPMLCAWIASWFILSELFHSAVESPITIGQRMIVVREQIQTHLLIAWSPVVLFSVVCDGLRPVFADESSALLAASAFVINLCLLMAVFPKLLEWCWDTAPLPPGPLRERLETIARRCCVRLPFENLRVWKSRHCTWNALVTGVFPGTKRVLLSEGLLRSFPDSEIEAIFTHELGHIVHRHLLWRYLMLVAPVSILLVMTRFSAGSWPPADAVGPIHVVLPTVVALHLLMGIQWYSRRLEHEADLFACRQLAQDSSPAEALRSYLRVLKQLDGRPSGRRMGFHPNYDVRRRFLINTLAVPRQADAFLREMKGIAGMLLLIIILPLLILY